MASGTGVEPIFTESKSVVLPLNEPPKLGRCSAAYRIRPWNCK